MVLVKRLRVLILLQAFLLYCGCTISASISSLAKTTDNSSTFKNVGFDSSSLNISEGSAALINIFLSQVSTTDTLIELSLVGNTSLIQPIPATLSIPAGSLSVSLNITSIDDSIFNGTQTIQIIATPEGLSATETPSHLNVTIADNDLGSFSISGITGISDTTQDGFLVAGLTPIVTWSASDGADSYDVAILNSTGSVTVCATQNTVSRVYNFASCILTEGSTYKASVTAKNAIVTTQASNSPFSFYVNRPPVANNDGAVRIMKGAGLVSLQIVTGSDSATRGTVADSDPDAGDTLSISSVTQGSSGGVVSISSTAVNYTASNINFTGVETFTYTLSDNHGATAIGTVTVHVFDSYTWTGKISSAWSNNGNWCGTISNNLCLGTTGYPNSTATASMIAIFDGTCAGSGHNCNATVSSATQAYGISLASTYTGTLTQSSGAGNTISVGSGGFSQNAGTFTGGTATFTVVGPWSLSGGTFTSTSGTFVQTGNFTVSGSPTFSGNAGILNFNMPCGPPSPAITPGSIMLNSALFTGSCNAIFNVSGTLVVGGTLTLNLVGGTFSSTSIVSAKGDISLQAWGGSGTGLIKTTGTGQTVTGVSGNLPNFEIASTGSITLAGTITVYGNYKYTSGAVTATGSTLVFYPGCAVTSVSVDGGSSIVYNNVTLSGSCNPIYVMPSKLNVGGNLVLNVGGQSKLATSAQVDVSGDITITSWGGEGGGLIKTVGVNQVITGAGGYLGSFEIASSGTVTLAGTVSIYGNYKYTSGTISASGSTLHFYPGCNYSNVTLDSGSSVVYVNVTLSGSCNPVYTLSSKLNVGGNLVLNVGGQSQLTSASQIDVSGDITSLAWGGVGRGLIRTVGMNQVIIAATGYLPNFEVASSGTVLLSGTVSIYGNYTYTSGTISATGSTLYFYPACLSPTSTITPGAQIYGNIYFSGSCNPVYTLVGSLLATETVTFNVGGGVINSGTISAAGNVSVANWSGGTTALNLLGPGQTLSQTGGNFPSGGITFNSSGNTLTLATNVSLPSASNFTLATGSVNMAGKSFTIPGTLNLTGNILTKNSGVLTVGGIVQTTGALFGGTVNP